MTLMRKRIGDYLSLLASKTPAPGGGSATALVAATGVALAEMVIGIMQQRRQLAAGERRLLSKTITVLRRIRKKAEQCIRKDAEAYTAVRRAYAMKKTDCRREQTIARALERSFAVMYDLAAHLCDARRAVRQIESIVTRSIKNDLILSALYIDGSFHGAVATARINSDCLQVRHRARTLNGKLSALIKRYKKK